MSKSIQETEDRKKDHIDLAFEAQMSSKSLDTRFYYEPGLLPHPPKEGRPWGDLKFAGKDLQFPLWVSSMTGGTAHAKTINHHLAAACKSYGMGMGLGSCRILMDSDDYLPDFDVRNLIGDGLPLFANLGIAQIEEALKKDKWAAVEDMVDRLDADGLIIHLNPMQEWFQPEGDRFEYLPIETIQRVLQLTKRPVIVKEVGQGMGPETLKALLQLPLEAIDFGAGGGTNFALLEALRADPVKMEAWMPLAKVGHSAEQMVDYVNEAIDQLGDSRKCKWVIISGGVGTFLDGYYCMQRINMPAIYAQASALLKRAMESQEEVETYLHLQREGLKMAYQYLRVK